MSSAIAINGSPRQKRGHTARLLDAFLTGLSEAGTETELYYPSRLKIKPCVCGQMQCWYEHPGRCSIQDDMQMLYPRLKAAHILVLATPVYIPLPGAMQNFINRLCPLLDPLLEFHQGRTRARFHADVHIQKLALVATGGWWEIENMATLVRIVQELADNARVEFAGALLRPHAFIMLKDGQLTEDGEEVLRAARHAGKELIEAGIMQQETLARVSRPLISEEGLRAWYNQVRSPVDQR